MIYILLWWLWCSVLCLKMCVHAQKHVQICFGRADMEVATVLALIVFPFEGDIEPLLLQAWGDCTWLPSMALPVGLSSNTVFWWNVHSQPWELSASMECLFLSLPIHQWYVTLVYVATAVKPEEFFSTAVRYKKHDTVYHNYKNSAVSQITHWEIPITQFQR